MTISASDERWLADARARASAGSWERDADAIFESLKREAEIRIESAPALPGCPACAAHPSMQRFPRHELLTADPILYCRTCYGFWAVGDSLSRGVADPGYNHPALEAFPHPRRCKACFGHLKPDDTCAKCGELPVPYQCPSCGATMQRYEKDGVDLDQCPTCRGTWFDTGEIVQVYRLRPAQSLAMSTVDENASDDEPPAWWVIANTLGRIIFPYLPI